jgi:hypothetical protein
MYEHRYLRTVWPATKSIDLPRKVLTFNKNLGLKIIFSPTAKILPWWEFF